MKADKGDVILIPGRKVGDPAREGRIVEVRGHDGNPPYLVRWADQTEGLFFPTAGAEVRHG